ncbi:hypothetical protein M3Y97_00641200 [Aphelenchoides bicaudatus]|nr:hypothetical protein M3Y97_00641200 [Aphelenchoides bicaudatus]
MKCSATLLLAFFGVAVYVSAQSPTSSPIKPGDSAKPDGHSPPPPGNASPPSPPASGQPPKDGDNSKPNVDPNKPNVDPNKPKPDDKKPVDDKKPAAKETPPTRTRRDDTNAQKPAEQPKPADQKPSEQQKANGQKFQLPSGGVPVGQAKDQIKSPRVRRQSDQFDGQRRSRPQQYNGPPDQAGNAERQQPGQIYKHLGQQGHQTYVPRSGPQPELFKHTESAPAVPSPLDSNESRPKRELLELGQNPDVNNVVPAVLPNDADSVEDEDSKDLSSNRHKRSEQVLEGKTFKDDSEGEDSKFGSDENEQEYSHDPLNPISSRARRHAGNDEGRHHQNKNEHRNQAGSGNADQADESDATQGKKHGKKGEHHQAGSGDGNADQADEKKPHKKGGHRNQAALDNANEDSETQTKKPCKKGERKTQNGNAGDVNGSPAFVVNKSAENSGDN